MAKVRVMRRNETGEMEELAIKPEILTSELTELKDTKTTPEKDTAILPSRE